MSAWVTGKQKCRCSLARLEQIVKNLMPDWASTIVVDPNGKLRMHKYSGAGGVAKEGPEGLVHLLIPGSGNPDHKHAPSRAADNDWGFRKIGEDEWQPEFCQHNSQQAEKLSKMVDAEATKVRLEEFCMTHAMSVKKSMSGKNVIEMEVEMTEEQAQQLGKIKA